MSTWQYELNGLIEYDSGKKEWYKNGILHREGGPAVIWPNGVEFWYYHNLLHREDGPAVYGPDATIKWFKRGLLHRTDGPAVIKSDSVEFWINGVLITKDPLVWFALGNCSNGEQVEKT